MNIQVLLFALLAAAGLVHAQEANRHSLHQGPIAALVAEAVEEGLRAQAFLASLD